MADEIAVYSALLTSVANTVELGRYCTLAGWVLMLYDHIIHFDKELELIWFKPWSVAKGLYLFNRYMSFIFLGIHSMSTYPWSFSITFAFHPLSICLAYIAPSFLSFHPSTTALRPRLAQAKVTGLRTS
ncbi:hypothetical protein CPB86DRAFT_311354 [Serendipita vermifera]|nr:hypothetical protein CPB86DRAFT_311354 [Serendipita vermifera]